MQRECGPAAALVFLELDHKLELAALLAEPAAAAAAAAAQQAVARQYSRSRAEEHGALLAERCGCCVRCMHCIVLQCYSLCRWSKA